MPADLSAPLSSTAARHELARPGAAMPHLHFVDGLRGLAMLMVLLYHCWMYGGRWFAPALSYGYVGVNLFLVLSGFCLYWPFTRPGRPEPTLWTFAVRRCRRILPPYYAALLFFWAFLLLDVLTHHHYHEDATSVRHVALSLGWHLVMLHNLSPDYVLSINGVFWSLGLEFSLYLLFPVLVEAFRRFGPWLPLGAALVVDLSWRHAVAGVIGPQTSAADGFVLCSSLPGRCFEFAAGMAAAWLMARARHGSAEGKDGAKGRTLGWICAGVSALAGAAAVWVTERFGLGSTCPDALWGLCFAALVVASIRPGSVLNRALSAPWLAALGVFSYSVYLVHLPLTKALDAVALSHHWPAALFGVLVIVPLMLLTGYVFHCVFERPFLRSVPSRPAQFQP